jgi:Zn-dependent protease/CBS domain-containing protein
MIGKGFRLGRLFGISIRIDWSWLLIFALVTWNLTSILSQVYPALGDTPRWIMASSASLLFFASVLAHELAHSLVARAQGVPVRSITLFLLGGVASLQREPPTPKVELTTAIAGPLASLALGGGLLLVSRAIFPTPISRLSAMAPLQTLLIWLGSINLLLAVFNMIPGFPLDGGRVLRAILWGISKSLVKATRWAAAIGQTIGWMMIVLGAALLFGVNLPLLGSGAISGLWLVFIGWFLNTASAQSYQHVALQNSLSGISVARLMRRDPPSVEPACTITCLVDNYAIRSDEQDFPVLDHNFLVGIVTLDDVHRVPRDQWPRVRVDEIMTPQAELVTISPQEDASEAMNKLIQRDARQLPVVLENCEFLGLLRRCDIMRWLQLNQKAIG